MPIAPAGTVTFLFTDIEGSTRLWQDHPGQMKINLTRHDALLRAAIENNQGYVFKTVGDAFCAAFITAIQGVKAAIEAQQALAAENWGECVIKVRIGLHTGDADERDNDYFGPTLNRVARLMSAGHGGQTLLSLATQELVRDKLPVGISLADLGERRLKDLIRPERIFQVVVPDLPADFPPLKTLDILPNNLPIQLTSFVGREKEMAAIKEVLAIHRLVTLTGSGGAGKTRLSLQVASDVLDDFPQGVWLVELAPLSDAALVPPTVAVALGVVEQPGRPIQRVLTDYLREKNLLLVLDNCEHLVQACAALVEALLLACPGLKILASSREALGITGEVPFQVPSLSIPDPRHLPPIDTLSQYEAVRLFIERATTVLPTFAVTNQNAPALAHICYRLDGLPLAIELAAARVKLLQVEQIAIRLDDAFRLLTGGSRTALPRQQTLRALIDWSYDLLPEAERVLLRRLSVFAGGWILDAAEAICSSGEIEPYEVLDQLTQLVNKSLVVVEREQGQEARYRLLETIRQYARDRLAESEEGETVRDRHLGYFIRLAEQAEPELKSVKQVQWLDRLDAELDNLRAAMEWGLRGHPGDPAWQIENGMRLTSMLGRFWGLRGYWNEGRDWLARALDVKRRNADLRLANHPGWEGAFAKTLHWAGELALYQDDYSRALACGEESLTLYRESRDKQGAAYALVLLGNVKLLQNDRERAKMIWEESLNLFREVGDKWGIGYALWWLTSVAGVERESALLEEAISLFRETGDRWGISLTLSDQAETDYRSGNYARIPTLLEEARILSKEIGDKGGSARSLRIAGLVAQAQRDYTQARQYYEECRALFEELGDRWWQAALLLDLGRLAVAEGNIAQAESVTEQGLTLARTIQSKACIVRGLGLLAVVAQHYENYERARSLLSESLRLAHQSGARALIVDGLIGFASLALASGKPERATRLSGAAESLYAAADVNVSPETRLDYDRDFAAAQAQLSEVGFATALAEGREMTLEQAIVYALAEPGP